MKKYFILSATLLMVGCSESELIENTQSPVTEKTPLEGVMVNVPDWIWEDEEDASTRTTITPTSTGMSFAWKEGDQIAIYASESMANFRIKDISDDPSWASFDGGGFSLTEGETYNAFYPYNPALTDKTDVWWSYEGQTQSANGSTEHLGKYDYMTSRTTATGSNEAEFGFVHEGSIVRIKATLPHAGNFTDLFLSANIPSNGDHTDFGFIHSFHQDFANGLGWPEGFSKNYMHLKLGENGITLTEEDLTLTTYLMIDTYSYGGDLIVIVKDDNERYYYSAPFDRKEYSNGYAYAHTCTLSESLMSTGISDCHYYVNLGLSSGALWATCNIGAANPEEFGNYFSWGETNGYGEAPTPYENCSPLDVNQTYLEQSIKTIFDYSHYKWGNCHKYHVTPGGYNTIQKEDDAASVRWGEHWRIPTEEELSELKDECTWVKINNNNIDGYLAIGPNGNSIFLPDTGYRLDDGVETTTHYRGASANYCIQLTKSAINGGGSVSYVHGCPIRPVYSPSN